MKRVRRSPLKERHSRAIRLALRSEYQNAMRYLNWLDPYAGTWIRIAGDAWEAYRVFTGYTIEEPAS